MAKKYGIKSLLLGMICSLVACRGGNEISRLQLSKDNIDEVMAAMTIDEKILLLKGTGMMAMMGLVSATGDREKDVRGAAGSTSPIPRLGIPAVILSDGPAGLRIQPNRRKEDSTYYATAFPVGTLLASSWDIDLVEEVGRAMGNEAIEYGVDVILGPGVNIHRNPLCGRNFEYYSEDPVLTGNIGTAMVKGIQSNGVGTSVKHFVANNQETKRNVNNAIVSERALREIYLKGFEIIAKESQPWTIMTSYNKVNGTYTSESRRLLTDILRAEWGFQGLVMTDWYGGRNAPAQIHAGNDLLEPGRNKQFRAIKKAVKDNELSMEDVDASVRRVLELVVRSRKLNGQSYGNDPDLVAHAEVTRQAAAEGMVLLKNEEALPLSGVQNIALFGVTSYDFIAGGTGAGDVNEAYTVSLEEGLSNAGFVVNASAKEAFETHKAANKKAFKKPEGTLASLIKKYDPPEVLPSMELIEECAAGADAAIVTIGRNSGEVVDRAEQDDFLLSADEQEMISRVCESFHDAGKKVVVVLNIGGVIETASWKDKPDAILLAWQGGQEGGNSVTDILIGNVNPSGKLPMTFPVHLADHASTTNFPLDAKDLTFFSLLLSGGKEKPEEEQVRNHEYTVYEEGIYIGYRHFDKNNIRVSYPFGFGLSYTSFSYEKMDINSEDDVIRVTLEVTNTGNTSGREVVEVYVSKPDTEIDRPVQELKAFAKTALLDPGGSEVLAMEIPVADLSYWNEGTSEWTLEKGIYAIRAGSSSRDIKLSSDIEL